MDAYYQKFLHLENRIHHQLVAHSIAALRIAVGLIFFGFGVLKFFPGVSPAESITVATTHILFLGLVPSGVSMVMIATLECVIGLCLLANRGMRLAIWLLAIEFVGILSPLVLLPGRLFAGPHHAPTLEGQYVLKDIILVAAALVIAAGSFRGGRLIRGDLPPGTLVDPEAEIDAEGKARIVLDSVSDEGLIRATCERNQIAEADFYTWRETSLAAAIEALDAEAADHPRPDAGSTVL